MTHAQDRQNQQQFEKKGQKQKRNMAQWRIDTDRNFAILVGHLNQFHAEYQGTKKMVGLLSWGLIVAGLGLVLLATYLLLTR